MAYNFRSERISASTIRIFTPTGESVYLVEGTRKAMLLDAGLGLGNLAEFVQSLTQKPLDLLVTHGHMDHSGGAAAFGKAYLNPKEIPLAESHNNIESKKQYAAFWLKGAAPDDRDFTGGVPEWLPLRGGDSFNLGKVTLVCRELPGHTAGIMTVLNREERSILLGDACNVLTMLVDQSALPVEQYKAELLKFRAAYGDEFDRVLLSHGSGDAPKAVLDGVISLCDDILAGNTDDLPFPFIDGVYTLAKAVNFSDMTRVDDGIGNIVYDKGRVR
ncbi:MAG: MBL fold metallo-hydrolase [Treponema sp.]|jgi:glyoxylase-like metal-dependent hydrolase (beta-lactamase superfamily II)|nr:MBL fold metallo-hydrolase [Treponema sp.]